jgi:hypothetical protein
MAAPCTCGHPKNFHMLKGDPAACDECVCSTYTPVPADRWEGLVEEAAERIASNEVAESDDTYGTVLPILRSLVSAVEQQAREDERRKVVEAAIAGVARTHCHGKINEGDRTRRLIVDMLRALLPDQGEDASR